MTTRKKSRQVTVNFRVLVKKCKQDFGLGPGVLYTFKKTFRDRSGRGFDNYMFMSAIEDTRREAIDEVIQVQALVRRPSKELKNLFKGNKS